MSDIKKKITWERLSEIATQALHGLIEDDYDSAMEYFRDTLDLTDEEREYFGVPTESEEKHKLTCSDCPYYYCDDEGEPEWCHYRGEERYAPCSYEEPEECHEEDYWYEEEPYDYEDRNYNRLYSD